MGTGRIGFTIILLAIGATIASAQFAQAQDLFRLVFPEQRTIAVRDPAQLPPTPTPDIPPPPTVAAWPSDLPPRLLSMDEAIRIALANSQVVRVLAGVTAVSSGQTVYDTAIANTQIDQARSQFDPQVQVQNSFNRTETPAADLSQATIRGPRTDDYRLNVGVTKPTITGGSLNVGVNTNPMRFRSDDPIPLNPQNRSSLELSYTQPLLQGGGIRANLAPIVIARINTEISFFQFKDSLQDLVRGVVEAYWNLVFARTDLWTRDQQVQQLEQAYERAKAQLAVGLANRAVVAQTEVSLTNFRASRVAARANVLQREAALRNILGLPPVDTAEIIPTTTPGKDRIEPAWQPLLLLAAERRPDIIELKLVLEADQQTLLLKRNQALPQLDGIATYRWNGLDGEMPVGGYLASRPGEFTDWTLAVNFSVPLGLRSARAGLRGQELVLARDRANLEQGVHQMSHVLATTVRNLAQYYEQYELYALTRAAARTNLEQQIQEYREGRVIFLNVLLAITDWGNAVSAEAQSLLQYNSELANLERQTGTILETHGIRFYEERFASIGPLGRLCAPHAYPSSLPPTPNEDHYPSSDVPAEKSFNLEDPLLDLRQRREPGPEPIPTPEPMTPVRILPPAAVNQERPL